MPEHSTKKRKKGSWSAGVELRASGDLHKFEKPGWSAGDIGVAKKVVLASSFSYGNIVVRLFDLLKVRKIMIKFSDLFKVSKMSINFFDLFKVSKQLSKKQLFKKQPSMHCLKHNIVMSKKIAIIQSQILTPNLTLVQCQIVTLTLTLVQCLWI